jgi:hypothetical protein
VGITIRRIHKTYQLEIKSGNSLKINKKRGTSGKVKTADLAKLADSPLSIIIGVL